MDPVWQDFDQDDGEEEDSSGASEGFQTGRDAMVFLVDASEAMFQQQPADDDGQADDATSTSFQLALKCARNTMRRKVVGSERDLISVVLFGTEKHNNPSDFKHVYIYRNLEQPSAEGILAVEKLMADDHKTFEDSMGHSRSFSLSDALWTCSSLFSRCTAKLASKRVLLFTNEDDPHVSNRQLQNQAKARAKDLFDSGIEIDLLHIRKPEQEFDISKFYRDIIQLQDDELYDKVPDAAEKFDELLNRVRMKEQKKRTLGSLRLTLGEGLNVAVGLYSLVRAASKPYPIKLAKSDNSELKSMSKSFAQDNAEILLPSDVKKCQEYAGKKIYMEADEVARMRSFGEPGLILMGFKPSSCLKLHQVRPAHFIYPDDRAVDGSTRVFSALHHQCLNRDRVPICALTARRNVSPRFVALLPQEREVDEHGVQVLPAGFHVIYLPFLEDVRKLQLRAKQQRNSRMVDKAKEIIKSLKFTYTAEDFENPVLQQHWRSIEALALDRDTREETTDSTQPDKELIDSRAGKAIADFQILAFPEDYDPEAGCKRKQTASMGNAHKRARQEEPLVEVDMRAEAQAGRLGRLTVSVLKEFCKNQGIRCGAKKADIIDAIVDFFKD